MTSVKMTPLAKSTELDITRALNFAYTLTRLSDSRARQKVSLIRVRHYLNIDIEFSRLKFNLKLQLCGRVFWFAL